MKLLASLSPTHNLVAMAAGALTIATVAFQAGQSSGGSAQAGGSTQGGTVVSGQASGSGQGSASSQGSSTANGGMLTRGWREPGKKIFSVVYAPGPNWLQGRPLREQPLQEHIQNLEFLLAKKVLVLAGPYMDAPGGEMVLQVARREDAEKIVANDPAVVKGILVPTIREWYIAFDGTTPKPIATTGIRGN